MLKHLYIRHFTIIDEVELELVHGLTVLTGETGAGKSILIDALEMVLGERAISGAVKQGAERSEVTAVFEVTQNTAAQQWLKSQEMDEGQECIIRRVIHHEGRSRSTINDRPCSLQLVRELGALLVHIHGQNQHQQLIKSDYQRELLDDYAQSTKQCEGIFGIYQQWREAKAVLAAISTQDTANQKAFLSFQIQELEELALKPHEIEELDAEHRRLSHAEQWIRSWQQAVAILAEEEQTNVLQGLYAAEALIKDLPDAHKSAVELLKQAVIQTEEATAEICQALHNLEPDPERMQWIEQRLSRIHNLARKHRTEPEQLLALQNKLQAQYQQLDQSAAQIELLDQKIADLAAAYQTHAKRLTESRTTAAKKFSAAITAQIRQLGMPNGCFEIVLAPREAGIVHPYGAEQVEFLITTNPGQSPQGIGKIASGGELSRIALAIQVVAAQATVLPTLIFDEVDVGIGGSTAEIVGQQLKSLGQRAQVVCVTHLPQVAAQGQQHLQVQKQAHQKKVTTQIRLLSQEERVQEIARMLGGVKITETTLAHAREMVG